MLISHRLSTVRHADRICVLGHGRVVELGTHDELMARGGRYQTMFDLQAQRFTAAEDEEGKSYVRPDPIPRPRRACRCAPPADGRRPTPPGTPAR